MSSTGGWTRKTGLVLLFVLGFGIGLTLRRYLIPLEIGVEELVRPWIIGSVIFLMIVGGVLSICAAVLYRYRHYLAIALGWGICAGVLVHSLLIFTMSLLIFTGGLTATG